MFVLLLLCLLLFLALLEKNEFSCRLIQLETLLTNEVVLPALHTGTNAGGTQENHPR